MAECRLSRGVSHFYLSSFDQTNNYDTYKRRVECGLLFSLARRAPVNKHCPVYSPCTHHNATYCPHP